MDTHSAPTDRTLAERAEALRPWATSGWAGYTRGVREALVDAGVAASRGNVIQARYWVWMAEQRADHYQGEGLDRRPNERLHTGELVPGARTLRELWEGRLAYKAGHLNLGVFEGLGA